MCVVPPPWGCQGPCWLQIPGLRHGGSAGSDPGEESMLAWGSCPAVAGHWLTVVPQARRGCRSPSLGDKQPEQMQGLGRKGAVKSSWVTRVGGPSC